MKRKLKRYSAGDQVEGDYESSDDAKNLRLAADREAVEYEGEKIAKPLREAAQAAKAEPMKMASFKEAFAEARGAGNKTFEYMGKKYSTDLAKPTAPAKTEAAEPPKSLSLADRQEAASVKMRGAYRDVAKNLKKAFSPTADNPRIRRERAEMGMKKGGSVKSASSRADGIAQRGKTRGKMV